MIIRHSLNFAVHLVGGIILGALAVAALTACRRRRDEQDDMFSQSYTVPPTEQAADSSAPAG